MIVPDDQLSLANRQAGPERPARLQAHELAHRRQEREQVRAAKTGRLPVASRIPGLVTDIADRLYEAGIGSIEEFVEAPLLELEDVTRLSGLDHRGDARRSP